MFAKNHSIKNTTSRNVEYYVCCVRAADRGSADSSVLFADADRTVGKPGGQLRGG